MSGRRFAILIGNSEFPADPNLAQLAGPDNDVKGLREVLTAIELGNFTEVEVLKNELHHQALEQINRTLNMAQRDDLVLIYYSGHGKLDRAGRLHLATRNTAIGALESTSIPVQDIRNYIDVSKSTKIALILDCCYSGAVGEAFRGDVNGQLDMTARGRGTYILTASTAIQTAVEREGDEGDRRGIFTKHLIEGIRSGRADRDGDGNVTMNEIYSYVHDEVLKESHQEPMKWDFNVRGELIVSKSGAKRWEERRAGVRSRLLQLANDDLLPDIVLTRALRIIGMTRSELSREDLAYDDLLKGLLDKGFTLDRFLEKWSSIRNPAIPAPDPGAALEAKAAPAPAPATAPEHKVTAAVSLLEDPSGKRGQPRAKAGQSHKGKTRVRDGPIDWRLWGTAALLLLLISMGDYLSDEHGGEVWSRTFGGTGDDEFNALAPTSHGGYVLAGRFARNLSPLGEWDGWLVKVNKAGREFVGNHNTFGYVWNGWFDALAPTSDGGYVLAGTTTSWRALDGWLVKVNKLNVEVWSRNFGGTGDDEFNALAPTSDGGYLLAGSTTGSTRRHSSSDYNGWLIKVNEEGREVWSRTFGGTGDDEFNALASTSDGYVLAGHTNSGNSGSEDGWLIKVNEEGREVWSRTFGGTGDDEFNALAPTSDSYVLAGSTKNTLRPFRNQDGWLVKIVAVEEGRREMTAAH